MSSLKLLDRFVEVYDAVEQGEDFSGEGGYVAHGPVLGVEEGKDEMHPASVDEGPGHEGKEGDLERGSIEKRWE